MSKRFLFDIDDLEKVVAANRQERENEIGEVKEVIEDELRQLGDDVKSLDLTLFDARNDSARKGRRNAIGNKLNSAANDVAAGYLADALATLNSHLLLVGSE